jgi:hypothetical protein
MSVVVYNRSSKEPVCLVVKCDQMRYINHKGKFFEDYNVVPTHNASDLIKCDQMPYINHKDKFFEDYNVVPT